MKLCVATNNQHKLEEINHFLGDAFQLITLKEIGCEVDIPETGTTLEENSLIKAKYVWDNYHIPCFADDSGLEVEALANAPGVYSARFAGEHGNHAANNALLLEKLTNEKNRNARFRTVITLIVNDIDTLLQFEGMVYGTIAKELSGAKGFGYDPLFIPNEHTRTFAEMTLDEKNNLSHRTRAVEKLVAYLRRAD
jgi:XTP/dITP diphosphohydrolase